MSASSSASITQRLADFSVNPKYDSLPPAVIAAAKNAILDTLGVALAGTTEEGTQMLLRSSTSAPGSGSATILGSRMPATPTVAALINTYAAHVLDYDDTQHNSATHTSAPVVPAALACAETQHRNGKDLIAAYVAGFEIGTWLSRVAGFGNNLMKRGFPPSGVTGVIGAAAAAGKLIGLNALQTKRSFGIATCHAAGTKLAFGTMAKAQNLANGSQNGVLSALLAREGFIGPDNVLDGELNLFTQFGGHTDADELFRNLGHQFELTENTLKIYACAGWRNPIVDASRLLAETHALKTQDVDRMEVRVCMHVTGLPNYPEPRTGLEGKFSAQYAAAVGFTDRAGGVAQFSDQRVADPELAALTRRVTLVGDEAMGSFQTRVTIHTKDGREFSHFIPIQKGKHSNPMNWEELAAKFRANAQAVLPQAQVDALITMVRDLDKLDDVAKLTRLCLPAKP